MKIRKDELITALSQFNPWWRGESIPDLPEWKRAVFKELLNWVAYPPTSRAVMLSGARQVGKTTLLLQTIDYLLKNKVSPANILYATFDHPLLKLAGIDAVLEAWRERIPKADGLEFLFLDEVQFVRDYGTWIKHQVDFSKNRRIVFTGSAIPLVKSGSESGVGRWHTIGLSTLSFYEYLHIKKVKIPDIAPLKSLRELFDWPSHEILQTAEIFKPYVGQFHEYLLRGGFPQTAQVESITQSQRLVREDIIDKVLKRDMTAIFGVRRILELEHLFLYLCMHGSGLLEMKSLCQNLSLPKPTVQHFIDLLEATHLIYRLLPYGYGKEILRASYKIYLADPAIAPAVLLKSKALLEDPDALGVASETAVFKHLYASYYPQNVRFSYWRGSKDKEVDLIAEIGGELVPFEVKYRSETTSERNLKGLFELCRQKGLNKAYIVTKNMTDFGLLKSHSDIPGTRFMQIPASLFCYWLGKLELSDLANLN